MTKITTLRLLKTNSPAIIILIMIVAFVSDITLIAQSSIKYYSFGNGSSEISNSIIKGSVTYGQSIIGYSGNSDFVSHIGFWYQFEDLLVETRENGNKTIPNKFELFQNYPNPFNPTTSIKYSIPKTSYVSLVVFDILGSEIIRLVGKEQTQGNYEIEFDGSDLTSGIYFYRIQAGEFVETKKMILLK